MLAGCTTGYKQATWYKKQDYNVSSSSPLPLATYNKHTNMTKESPLQFLLTKLVNVTKNSIRMFKQWNSFFFLINLKSKYINLRKGVPYPSTNPALQGLAFTNKQGKATMTMLRTETKIKIPINDIAKITLAADFGDLKK